MRKRILFLFFLIAAMFFSGCSINKFIPPDKRLLKKYEIKYTEKKNKAIDNSEVKAYLRPKTNAHFLGVYYNLNIYYLSKVYPVKFYKWLNKKLGEDPVYIDDVDPERMAMKIKRFLINSGFFDIKISYEIINSKKRAIPL